MSTVDGWVAKFYMDGWLSTTLAIDSHVKERSVGGLEQQDGLSILQILDKLEEVCDTLLSRFDPICFIMEKVWLITLQKNILKPFT